ncbi:MAG TPA: Gfo/Idh/MocA family oxidoreductase, partial [Patescibacteria group bacterium]|nr:Gfo/Idh/MocA family oxidoreductase [Patescibacteria group bacterium]
MVSIAVIGTGHLGAIHTRLLKNTPNARLAGIYDQDKVRAEKIASEYETTAFKDLAETFKN